MELNDLIGKTIAEIEDTGTCLTIIFTDGTELISYGTGDDDSGSISTFVWSPPQS